MYLAVGSQSVDRNATARYMVELTNPLSTNLTYSLTIDGLQAGETADLANSVTVAAGQAMNVPFTVSVPAGAVAGTQAFVVSAQTAAGASDSVEGQLTITAQVDVPSLAVNLMLTPTSAVAGQPNPAVYTLSVTNAGDPPATYTLSRSF